MSRQMKSFPTYLYWVQVNYLRLTKHTLFEDLGPRWEEVVKEHWKQGVLPMDAARGIRETEVQK